MSRDEEILKTLYIAKVLARRFSCAYGDYIDFQTAYDIAEETVVRVYDRWTPERGTFKTFAWRCCERALNRYVDNRKKRYGIENTISIYDEETIALPSNENIQEQVQARLLIQSVIRYAATLTVLQRQILACICSGETNVVQIGRTLNVGHSYVHRQRNEAINRLKTAVGI